MNEHRDNSDRLTFDFNGIEHASYNFLTQNIVEHFDLGVSRSKIEGLNEIFQEFSKGELLIGLEWDNWSGFIVNAKTKDSEELAREVANYIDEKINHTSLKTNAPLQRR